MTKDEQQPFHDNAGHQRESGEKQPVEGISAINRADYIPYPKAMRLLAERIGATPEEMAAWIFYGPEMGGLEAYEDIFDDALRVFSYGLYAVARHTVISPRL
jgi:hypothetical protein